MDNSDVLNARSFRTGRSSCGGGIGSSVRSCQDKEREKREKEREREREGSVSFKRERVLRKREACDWKEGRKEGNEVREGREVVDMDGWIRVDGHMGEHFRGTGGR